MTKITDHVEYEQFVFDFGDEFVSAETIEESEPENEKPNELSVGAEVTIKPETKLFCDGRGIPDYARKAYIKRINHNNKTVLLESAPNGKEYGLLFVSDVTLV